MTARITTPRLRPPPVRVPVSRLVGTCEFCGGNLRNCLCGWDSCTRRPKHTANDSYDCPPPAER